MPGDAGKHCKDEAIEHDVEYCVAWVRDTELNSFSIPDDPAEPEMGGLAVNLKGNTRHANGICNFSGFYMNQSVEGMHQGWIETCFDAVDMQKLILSNKYCLAGKTRR